MNICQAISMLQKLCRIVKGIELLYNHDEPLKQEIIVNSTQEGFKLIFDAENQQLKIIEIYDLNKITLRYCSHIFSVPYEKTTVEQVEQAFGATHPGTYDSSSQTYVLNWRGISFSFLAESNIQPLQGRGLGSLQFSQGSAPVVNKVHVFTGNSIADCKSPEVPLSCYNGNCSLDSVEILRHENKCCGLSISLFCETFECTRFAEVKRKNIKTDVYFGDTCQDVLQRLGCPNRLYFKDEDKMKIHLPSDQRLKTFSSMEKQIRFENLYYEPTFRVITISELRLENDSSFFIDESESAESDASTKSREDDKTVEINPFTKWEYIYDLVADPLDLFSTSGSNDNVKQTPVVLNRCNTNNSTNPFGSTFCYCYKDIIFEIMSNNHIASLTIFDDPSKQSI
uniref:Uncharacterized protein n=1 Tax=Romanomermis culicivorax TaxID=13658 RepID=A0A915HYQ0_ROMCU